MDEASPTRMVEACDGQMSQSRAIAVFVKTPGLSPVKTRLAEGIGAEKALEFYTLALECVTELVQGVDATPIWAVAEKETSFFKNFETIWTDDGGLGQRQHHIYKTLLKKYDQVMLLGTDAPQLTSAMLEEAFEKLDTHDFVFGPSHDGGYNFMAGKKDIPLNVLTSVEYSQDTTREALCAKLSNYYMMPPFLDVDHIADLQITLEEMPDVPTKTQQKMIDWAKETLISYAA
ncbi:MAG: hypothetical protein DHS20C02_08920 [Micavibrio sp.]|nr:MAG: hypothetical protein DHS20C02_08920 [Micavibrio sp.]